MAHVQAATVLLLMFIMCMGVSCPPCITGNAIEEELLGMLLSEIAKEMILSRLRLKERPNVTFPASGYNVQEALKKLDTQEDPHQNSRVEGQVYKQLSFAKPGRSLFNGIRLHFGCRLQEGRNIELLQASLYFFWPLNSQPSQRVTVRLLLPMPNGSNLTLIGEKELELKEKGWSTLEVGSVFQACFSQGHEVLTVDLETESQQELPLLLTNMSSHQPFRIVEARELAVHQLHRRELECDRRSRCCKKSFYISFKDVGWDGWIVAPLGFHTNYCTTLCEENIAPSVHDFLSNFVDRIAHRNKSSHCVPTAFKPLSLLYIMDDSIVFSSIPDMIVEDCSCS
ncbi:inhibin beta C chain-like [Elgaria multicarinata webbii]|uniref:inhibin beta C chain-like n=1 Tax=Elgaria multicarinata webbii TaxID=159646 RepID=UPI002FCCCB39